MAILYKQDWERYPTAVPDIPGMQWRGGILKGSSNYSWLEQAYKFREMGVDHWYFILALYTPELSGVDVRSPHLTDEQKGLILLECAHNPWYVLREVIRVPSKSGGGDGHPLRANRGNIAMFWSVFNSFITYVQQIRQTGKSLNTRALVVAWHLFWAIGSQHILFTKGDLRKEEIKEYKALRSLIPAWMWELTDKDTDNQHEFTNLGKGNRTKSYIPQGDPEAANNVGRGTTPTIVTVDEPPFLPYAGISIPALSAATGASFDEAAAKKAMHFILFTTTAGDLSTESGKYVYENIKKVAMFFSEILYDSIDRADAVKTILANSSSPVPRLDISFTHNQLGYTDEWLKTKVASVSGKVDQIKRDYLNQWTYGSASNPIPEKLLNKIRNWVNKEVVTRIDPRRHYALRFHVPYDEVINRKSVMGLDTSNAVGRDAITGVDIDVETTETLMAFAVSETFLEHFGDWLVDFLVLFPNLTLIPENKSSWAGIGDKLLIKLPLKGVDPGRRIYSRIVDNAEESERDRKVYREYCHGVPSERKYSQFRTDFGFNTNADLRTDLYTDVLRAATNQSAQLIRDPVLIDELSSLVVRKGRIDHSASGHDDHVISWLMANWFLRYARNLDHYGIDVRKVLSRLKIATGNDTPKELNRRMKQEKMAAEIAILEERMDNARSAMEAQYYGARLRSLKSELQEHGDEDTLGSIDRLSEEVKSERVGAARARHPGAVFGGGRSGNMASRALNMYRNR